MEEQVMKSGSPSVGLRAVMALGLMIGFYALALGLAAVLLWLPYAEVTYTDRVHVKLAIMCVLGAGIILWSILPRRDRFEAPGPQLDPARHPKLFQMIRGVASATKQEMPSEVYLVGDMNAWVAHRGGLMGLRARGIMGLGLPLLQTLTVSELRAVLAHEFGHYSGGDTKLGRFVYSTRAAIGRTLDNLGYHGSILQLPFLWYGRLFLRVSHAVSRRQELAADRLAAQVVGARPLAEGLKKIHNAAPAFSYYWSNEVAPVLRAGFVPPLADGFQQFVAGEIGQKALAAAQEQSLAEGEGDVYDTHPPLQERLQALQGLRAGDTAGADPLAITLLADPQALERGVIAPALPPADGQKLTPIQWSEVGERVYQPLWHKETQSAAAHCRPLTVEALGQRAGALAESLGAKLLPEGNAAPPETRQLRGNWSLGSALAVTLSQAGWATEAPPGEPVTLKGPGGALDPFGSVHALVKGELTAEAWAQQCERLGIAGLEMLSTAPGSPRVGPRPAPVTPRAVAEAPVPVVVTDAPRPVAVAEETPRAAVAAPMPVPMAAVADGAPRTRRCWRCKEPVALPAESGGERPRCAKCGTLQWVPA
jgi:Zn-dependent protease with chaperone function